MFAWLPKFYGSFLLRQFPQSANIYQCTFYHTVLWSVCLHPHTRPVIVSYRKPALKALWVLNKKVHRYFEELNQISKCWFKLHQKM